MTAIAMDTPDTTRRDTTSADWLYSVRRRVSAWRRHRNYPAMRRARREAVLDWAAACVQHRSGSR